MKLLLAAVALTIGCIGLKSAGDYPQEPEPPGIEDKIILNVDAPSTQLLDSGEANETGSIEVVFEYVDDFPSDHDEIDSLEERTEHRIAAGEHFQRENEERAKAIALRNYTDVYVSKYSPFIVFEYPSLSEFLTEDYAKLSLSDSDDLCAIFVDEDSGCDLADRNDSSVSIYPFTQAKEDIGLPDHPEYDGTGIKIGSIEGGAPDNSSNLAGVTCHVFGEYRDPHAFYTSSIYGGNSGIAKGAEIYFACLENKTFIQCADWLVENDVDVVNVSAGWMTGSYDDKSAYVDFAAKQYGISFCVSAGNEGESNKINSVSIAVNAISVASNDSNLKISSFSSSGLRKKERKKLSKPTLTAPGGSLYGIPYVSETISGTSLSAPMVTGIVAILMQEFPLLRGHPENVLSALTVSAIPIKGQEDIWDEDAGFGLVNYERARKAARAFGTGNVTGRYKEGESVWDKTITISSGETFHFNNTFLFNGTESTKISSVKFSALESRLKDSSGRVVATSKRFSNFSTLIYTNNGAEQEYRLDLYLLEDNRKNGISDFYGFTYFLSDDTDLLNIRSNISFGYKNERLVDSSLERSAFV